MSPSKLCNVNASNLSTLCKFNSSRVWGYPPPAHLHDPNIQLVQRQEEQEDIDEGQGEGRGGASEAASRGREGALGRGGRAYKVAVYIMIGLDTPALSFISRSS